MTTDVHRSLTSVLSGSSRASNLSTTERWVSAATGLSLTLSALRSGGLLSRLLWASAGLSLLARGATGYCAVKGALAGDMPFKDGLKQQFRQLKHAVSSDTLSTIEDMPALYAVELRELHSAETQLAHLIERIVPAIQNAALKPRLDEYVAELQSRQVDLESLLARAQTDTRVHADDAMRALLGETQKMSSLCAPALRDAAITASLQRIVHYKIAGYGTIAAYARSLGRVEEAAHFADLADRDKVVDRDLTRLAKETLNPEANATSSQSQVPGSLRTH